MNIPTMVYNKYGNEMSSILMIGASHMKYDNINLISATRPMMSGWMLSGDEKLIQIKKGELEVTFDIVIKPLRAHCIVCI